MVVLIPEVGLFVVVVVSEIVFVVPIAWAVLIGLEASG